VMDIVQILHDGRFPVAGFLAIHTRYRTRRIGHVALQ
jgi:hypothetical protein